MREDSDVDTFRRANEAEHRITEDAIPPGVAVAVSNENLRDAFLTRKFDNRGYRIVAFQNFGRGAGLFRRVEISSNRDSLSFGPTGLAYVHRVEFSLKALFVAFPAFNHCQSIGMWRHTNEKTFVGPEDRLDSVRMNIGSLVAHRRLRQSAAGRVREVPRADAPGNY